MSFEFSANEIFDIAIEIEHNGGRFYRNAAAGVSNSQHQAFLNDLARMEDEHVKIFESMQAQLKDAEKSTSTFDPDNEAAQYLKALADTRVFFEKKIDTSSMRDILKAAIEAEKDSIVFYLGMKELVPEKQGKHRMDAIIKEEMNHIRHLSRELLTFRHA